MKKLLIAFAAIAITLSAGFAATPVTYTASNDPNLSPDGNANTVDVWSIVNGGSAGSYFGGPTGNDDWVLYSVATTGFIYADHTFAGGPLTIGQTVSIDFANSGINTLGGSVAVELLTNGTAVARFFFDGGDSFYSYSDTGVGKTSTGKGYSFQTPFTVSWTLTGAGSYDANAGGTLWSGAYAGSIDGIRVLNYQGDNNSDVTFNNLSVVPEPSTCLLVIVGLAGLLRFRRR